jgi:Calcineurin-like phosphoesterase
MSKWSAAGLAGIVCCCALWLSACGSSAAPTPVAPTPIAPTPPPVATDPDPGTPTPPPTPPPTPTPPPAPPPGNGSPTVPEIPIGTGTATAFAVGDVGWCGSPGVALTARLLQTLFQQNASADLLLLGDLAYMNGRMDDYQRCFNPEYGRFRSRFRPVPGNHEFMDGYNGYYQYFGAAAGPGRDGFYAFRAAAWKVLMLNSEATVDSTSQQYVWARDQLRRDPTRCTAVVWHKPYITSGPNGPNPQLRDMWQMLAENGAEVVLSGHDHLYERFAPQDYTYRPSTDHGMRQFIVGTGGANLYRGGSRFPNSEVVLESFGVLKLTLQPQHYEWEFVDATTNSILDRGIGQCH